MSIAHSFGVSGTSGVLGSWLGTSTTTANAASILGGSTTTGNAFSALAAQNSTTAPSTAQALSAGKLTNSQQRVIAAIGDNNGPLTIPWNANGSEPSTVAAIRSVGWLKLDKKVTTSGKVSGVYELTKVGEAIYNRTGGGSVSGAADTPLTSTDTNGTASTASSTSALQSTVSSLTSILGSVGVSV